MLKNAKKHAKGGDAAAEEDAAAAAAAAAKRKRTFDIEQRWNAVTAMVVNKEDPSVVCKQLGITRYTILHWKRRFQRQDGTLDKSLGMRHRGSGRKRVLDANDEALILKLFKDNPSISNEQVCERLGNRIKPRTVSDYFQRLGKAKKRK